MPLLETVGWEARRAGAVVPDPPMSAAGTIRVGIGGWVFPPWRGTFYPPGLVQARELSHASRQVTAIEINGTFYGSQKPESFRRWHDETPDDFVFSVKGPRFVTHRRDLATAGPSIDRFFASGVLELGAKLGPILWQFAPFMRFDEAAFAAFLALLPREIDGRSPAPCRRGAAPELCRPPPSSSLLRRHTLRWRSSTTRNIRPSTDITADFVYARLRRCAGRASRLSRRRARRLGRARAASGAPTAAIASSISSTAPKSAPRRRRKR